MKTSKKLSSVLLVLLLLLSMSYAAFGVGGTTGELNWSYNEATKTLTVSGTGAMKDYGWGNTPPWYQLDDNSGRTYLYDIESVVIENGVTRVGENAFEGCETLKSVTILDGVKSIGMEAFHGCNALKSVTFPNSVTSIDSFAFLRCIALESVTIPDSVTSIGEYAFFGCNALTETNYTGTEAQWNSIAIGSENEPLVTVAKHYNYGATQPENPGNPDPEPEPQPKPQPENLCKWCGEVHKGFFQSIVGFFHRILAAILGAKY